MSRPRDVVVVRARAHGDRSDEQLHSPDDLLACVQRRTVSRGRRAKSQRLLSRLGAPRCGSCGSMVINNDTGNYRCGDTSADRCSQRVAVGSRS